MTKEKNLRLLKPQTIYGERIIKIIKLFEDINIKASFYNKIRNRIIKIDNKVASMLHKIAYEEWVITRENIVSKSARRILGVRLPEEPEYFIYNGKKVTRWAAVANEAAKKSHAKDTDVNRVTSLQDYHKFVKKS